MLAGHRTSGNGLWTVCLRDNSSTSWTLGLLNSSPPVTVRTAKFLRLSYIYADQAILAVRV